MTPELAIENDIVTYLQQHIFDYAIEPFTGDIVDIVLRAKKHLHGLIVVAHAFDSAVYEHRTRNTVLMTLPYAINIMCSDRRSGVGLYEILARVRDAMLNYNFNSYPIAIVSHMIDPMKFPDQATGVFRAQIDLQIKISLSDIQKYLNEN